MQHGFGDALSQLQLNFPYTVVLGRAGTGKSELLKLYVENNTDKNIAVVAPTGIAAVNVAGVTIHSFFKFPPHYLGDLSICINDQLREVIEKLDILVIDEIPMVRVDIISAIDRFLRLYKGKDVSFGGVRVIGIGDPFQLSPIVKDDIKGFIRSYKSEYFFDAPVGENMRIIQLTHVHRQNDPELITNLAAIREGTYTKGTLDYFNSRVVSKVSTNKIQLCSTNFSADSVNEKELKQLKGEQKNYNAAYKGSFDSKDSVAEAILSLKEGASVMFIRNDLDKGAYVNGTMGVVSSLEEDKIIVTVNNSQIEVRRSTWEKYAYERHEGRVTPVVIGEMRQYPLKLAYAVTIHKAQGLSLDAAHINLGKGAFAPGQTYVALSRVRTLQGLSLAHPIKASDVIVHKRVAEFMRYSNSI